MQRNYQANDFVTFNLHELNKRIAYHEAGHATAIYLYNKQKQLPPIYFQITLKNNSELIRDALALASDNVAAKVEGGCLIQNLILTFIDSEHYMSETEKADYHTALEADIINLLAGAVAEANYVSLADNEIINAHLLSIHALGNYGSHSDLIRIDEYLTCLSKYPEQQKQKLAQLLIHTFEFISQPKTWKAVKAVADFILTCKKQTISCEEVFAVIDAVNM
jgi:Arc/MetJ-type ribon-helix-helix transcriptional regulator